MYLQDPKLFDKLSAKHGEQLDDKSLTICSGVDYTNINYQHVVCPDVNTAKVILVLLKHFVNTRRISINIFLFSNSI